MQIDYSKIRESKASADELSSMSLEELMEIRTNIVNHKEKRYSMIQVQMLITGFAVGRKRVPQIMFPAQVYSLGIDQSLTFDKVTGDDGVVKVEAKIVYGNLDVVKTEIGMVDKDVRPTITAGTKYGYPDPKPISKILNHLDAEVKTTAVSYLHACRLIAAYFRYSDGEWNANISSANTWPFKDVYHLPNHLERAASYLAAIKLGMNMKGRQLYYYLANLHRGEQQQLILAAASGLGWRELPKKSRKAFKVKIGTDKETVYFPDEGAACHVSAPNLQKPNTDIVMIYFQRLSAIEQKIGGSDFAEICNEYFDGVHLGNPDNWHRTLLKGISNIDFVSKCKRILLVASDANFVRKCARTLRAMGYNYTLYVRGIPSGTLIIPDFNLVTASKGLLGDYDLVLCSDVINKPSMEKKLMKSASYHTLMSQHIAEALADYGDNIVYSMCPLVEHTKVIGFLVKHLPIFNPCSTHLPMLFKKKQLVPVDVGTSPLVTTKKSKGKRRNSDKQQYVPPGLALAPQGVSLVGRADIAFSASGYALWDLYELMIIAYSGLVQYPWTFQSLKGVLLGMTSDRPKLITMLDATNYRAFLARDESVVTENGVMYVMVPVFGRLDVDTALKQEKINVSENTRGAIDQMKALASSIDDAVDDVPVKDDSDDEGDDYNAEGDEFAYNDYTDSKDDDN